MTDLTVSLSEVRRRLIDEHVLIRGLLGEVDDQAREYDAGVASEAQLRHAIELLYRVVVEHNLSEEQLLRPLLEDIDAWGPLRVAQMISEHLDENAELHVALLQLKRALPSALARGVQGMVQRLRGKFEEEERTYLAPGVLRDDLITVEDCS